MQIVYLYLYADFCMWIVDGLAEDAERCTPTKRVTLQQPGSDGQQTVNKKNDTNQLLYIYSIPPGDGLQICPKHVEVDWRNELRINNTWSWFSLHRCLLSAVWACAIRAESQQHALSTTQNTTSLTDYSLNWNTLAWLVTSHHTVSNNTQTCSRLQLKCDGTRWPTGGEVNWKLANGVCSQYSSHYLGTWCIQHYYRWCAHFGFQ